MKLIEIRYNFSIYFSLWFTTLIPCFLVIDFIYRIDSMLRYGNAVTILVDISFLVIFFTLLSVMISSINTAILESIGYNDNFARKLIIGNKILALALILGAIIKNGKEWLFSILSFEPRPTPLIIKLAIVVISIFICYLKKEDLIRWQVVIKPKIIYLMLIFCLIILSYQLIRELPIINNKSIGKLPADKIILPNVILITMDSLSAIDMSLYGYMHKTTPNIDNFAESSFVFSNMFSNSNWTRPSIASILSGVRPDTHGLISRSNFNNYSKIDISRMNIAAYLKEHGYNSYAVIANPSYAHPRANETILSFDQHPYETIDQDYVYNYKRNYYLYNLTKYFTYFNSSANMWLFDIIDRYLPWLNRSLGSYLTKNKWETNTPFGANIPFEMAKKLLSNNTNNIFCWIHLYPPHSPYLPPDKFKHYFLKENKFEGIHDNPFTPGSRFYSKNDQPEIDKLRLRYDEFILYADAMFGDFIDYLKQNGLYDTSIVIVAADHGESFNNGYLGHGGQLLYPQLVRVPLIIHMPGQQGGKTIISNTEQVDILPTVTDLIFNEVPSWCEGESMKNAMYNNYISNKPKYIMELEGSSIKAPLTNGTIAVVQGYYKYVHSLTKNDDKLFNMKLDPKEDFNLLSINTEKAQELKNLIFNYTQKKTN